MAVCSRNIVDHILHATTPRPVQVIRLKMKSHFLDCCGPVLARISEYPVDEDAWKLLFCFLGCCCLLPQEVGKRRISVLLEHMMISRTSGGIS